MGAEWEIEWLLIFLKFWVAVVGLTGVIWIVVKVRTLYVMYKSETIKESILSQINAVSIEDFDVKEINERVFVPTKTNYFDCIYFDKKIQIMNGDIGYRCYIPKDHIRNNESVKAHMNLRNVCKMDEIEIKKIVTKEEYRQFKKRIKNVDSIEVEVYAVAVSLNNSCLISKITEWLDYLKDRTFVLEAFETYAWRERERANILLGSFVEERIKCSCLISQEPFNDSEKRRIIERAISKIKECIL
jgi:hypothetical protein